MEEIGVKEGRERKMGDWCKGREKKKEIGVNEGRERKKWKRKKGR